MKLPLVLLLPLAADAVVWEDKCDGDWLKCRANTIKAIFNSTTTPARDPDFVIPYPNYTMKGLPGPGSGTGVGNVEWENNLTALVWTMTGPFLTLNTTVLYSLNTSGRAAANYNPPPYSGNSGPGIPPAGTTFDTSWAPQVVPHKISDTLLIYHNGHETATCTPNYDGVVDYYNEIGYDVMEMMMPLIGCNQAYQYGNPHTHQWFEQWEEKGDYTMRYFIEPVARASMRCTRRHLSVCYLPSLSQTSRACGQWSLPTQRSWDTSTSPCWVSPAEGGQPL